MKLGDYEVRWTNVSMFKLDGGAMFGVVPKPVWERLIPSDSMNRIELGLWVLEIRGFGRTFIVDTGIWGGFDEKLRGIYAAGPNQSELHPESVSDVILTHLHFDHAGGGFRVEPEGVVPLFPNARYHTSRTQLNWALNPSSRDRASYIPQMVTATSRLDLLEVYEEHCEPAPGLELMEIGGHSPGMTLVKISGGGKTVLHTADMTPTSSHIPVPYVMAYDLAPLETVRHRQELYARAYEEGWMLFLQHDPIHPLWTLARDEKGRYSRGEPVGEGSGL